MEYCSRMKWKSVLLHRVMACFKRSNWVLVKEKLVDRRPSKLSIMSSTSSAPISLLMALRMALRVSFIAALSTGLSSAL